MSSTTIGQLIVNSPYIEPTQHWNYDRPTRLFSLTPGRRPAGYVRASANSRAFDDPGEFVELPLVNQIRPRVEGWRVAGYPGVSGITRRLLDHWRDSEQRPDHRFFFCQLEAIETLIWLAEAPDADRVGIDIPDDGGAFRRLCSKMATGSGKTIIMAMLIAWQVLNKVTYPQDKRFAKNVLVIAPGLTVKSRLQVLLPSDPGNYYDVFNVVPPGLADALRQGKVLVRNWHTLKPLDPEAGPKVVKKGPESDESFTRRVLVDMASARNLVVINDEAHHAWRVPPKSRIAGVTRDEIEEATQWIGGLDRIHKTRGILTCFDLTATPFAPTGRRSGEETLFDWIVSDFGLNDAIESGLVKTPRVVVRDDGSLTADYKSRLYHIYADKDVKDDLNRRALPHEPLPDLVVNGYYLLGKDWLETANRWIAARFPTPPVMITVANRTETSARVDYALTHGKVRIDELSVPERILHIDSRVLAQAEAREDLADDQPAEASADTDEDEADAAPARKLSQKDRAEALRRKVDTIGQVGKPGEQIQSVISVGMLSEGWDAKTVTHIMGLRAFTSQLLCEQVVGRGLRRTSYEVNPKTGLFESEYVNIFGVPFTFLPHEGGDGPPPPPPSPKTLIEPVPAKAKYEISWPNVIRIEHEYRPTLTLDLARVEPLILRASDSTTHAEIAPILAGKADVTQISEIELADLGRRLRLQKIVFEAAVEVYDQMQPTWKGSRELLIGQLIRLVERIIAGDRIQITPPLFNQDELRRRIILTLNMNKIVQHVWEAIRVENTASLAPVFDSARPIRSTGDMPPWFTGRPCEHTDHSHINQCVFDSTWEASEEYIIDQHPRVAAWVKNDHLGFEIVYVYRGVVKKYRPDFLIRLYSGTMLVLEVKGQETEEAKAKRTFLDEWVRAVNAHGGFGTWSGAVSREPGDVAEILLGQT
jgi:type III restriction enzyme